MLRKFYLTPFFLLISVSLLQAQNLTYAVLLRDEQVGTLHVKRTITKDQTDYKLESTIKVEKIINMLVEYQMNATFVHGILKKSITLQKSNGKVNTYTRTTHAGSYYQVELLNGKRKEKEQIDFNLCTLYFQEPAGKKRIWSDSYGTFIRVRPVGPHRYELLLPDGKKNYYTYHFGICSMVETEQMFSKITFRLIPAK